MSSSHEHVKHFADFLGIDLRSNEVLRARGFSSDGTENVVHSPQGGVTMRWGSHIVGPDVGATGLYAFSTVDLGGTAKTELVGFEKPSGSTSTLRRSPYALTRATFTITNSNATSATAYHYYDESVSEFRFRIARSGSNVVAQNLGIGTEASPYMLSSLETVVDAAADLAMSTPANASTSPAAFMELINGATIAGSGGTLTIAYWYWTAITIYSPLVGVGMVESIGLSYFIAPSAVVLNNVLYVASNENQNRGYLHKYDGNRFYRAGLPSALDFPDWTTGGAEVSSGTAVTDDVRGDRTITSTSVVNDKFYKLCLVNIDKAGNRVQSDPILSTEITYTEPAPIVKVIADDNDLDAFGVVDYNKAFARCSSTATSLTVTVTAGHTMQAGDVAFFWDNLQGRFIQRIISSTTATTLVLSSTSLEADTTSVNFDSGATPRVLSNALITNNARIALYRAATVDGEYRLVDEFPNYLFSAALNTAYGMLYDTTDEDVLAGREALIESEFGRDPPPNCARVSAYNGGLILSGDLRYLNRISYSDVDGPEYFPKLTHHFNLPAVVTGHRQSGEYLVMGCSNSLHVTSGVLSEFNFRVDQIGANVGVQSHHSMEEFEEGVLAFSSNVGPQVLISGRQLEPLGALTYPDGSKVSRIAPFWTRRYSATAEQPIFSRARAVVLPNDKLYVLFVPFEDPSKPVFATSNSVCWVFDYGRGAWWKWTGLNMAGGMTVMNNDLYWVSVAHDGGGTAVYTDAVVRLHQQQRSVEVGVYAYADHSAVIPWKFRSHWETLGKPDVYKRALRCRIRSAETRASSSTTLDLNTYINEDTSLQSTDDTITWTTEKAIKVKVKGEKFLSMMTEFAQSARYQPPLVTGYTMEYVAPFRQEMKE